MAKSVRLTIRADDDVLPALTQSLSEGCEHRLECPICGADALVVRTANGQARIFCEYRCPFTAIRQAFQAAIPSEVSNIVESEPDVRLYRNVVSPKQSIAFRSVFQQDVENRLYVRRHRFSAEIERLYGSPWDHRRRIIDGYFQRDEKGHRQIQIGWVPVIRALLEQKGLRAEVFPRRRGLPRRVPGSAASGTVQFFEFIRRHDRGLIRVREAKIRPAALIAAASKAWPRMRIVVVTRSCRHAERLHSELRSTCVVGLVTRRQVLQSNANVVLTEARWISCREVQLDHAELLVVLDATLLTCEFLYDPLLSKFSGRIYGLAPVGVEFRPFEDDRITSLLGFSTLPLLSHIQKHDGRVRVHTVSNKCGVNLSKATTLGEVKRWASGETAVAIGSLPGLRGV